VQSHGRHTVVFCARAILDSFFVGHPTCCAPSSGPDRSCVVLCGPDWSWAALDSDGWCVVNWRRIGSVVVINRGAAWSGGGCAISCATQHTREHLCNALMRGVWGGRWKLLIVNVARFCLHGCALLTEVESGASIPGAAKVRRGVASPDFVLLMEVGSRPASRVQQRCSGGQQAPTLCCSWRWEAVGYGHLGPNSPPSRSPDTAFRRRFLEIGSGERILVHLRRLLEHLRLLLVYLQGILFSSSAAVISKSASDNSIASVGPPFARDAIPNYIIILADYINTM